MTKPVLIVEKSDRVRAGLRNAISSRGLQIYDVTDAFDAMSVLGRADFGAVVVSVGKRQLSLRGLCQLARRRHPGIRIFIIFYPGMDVSTVAQAIGVEFDVVAPGTTTTELAGRIEQALREAEFVDVPHTFELEHASDDIEVSVEDAEPTISTPLSPAAFAALQQSNARDAAREAKGPSSFLVEPSMQDTERMPTARPRAPSEDVRTVLDPRPAFATQTTSVSSGPVARVSTKTSSDVPLRTAPRPITDPWAKTLSDPKLTAASSPPPVDDGVHEPELTDRIPVAEFAPKTSDVFSRDAVKPHAAADVDTELIVTPSLSSKSPSIPSVAPLAVDLPELPSVAARAPTMRVSVDDGFSAQETLLETPAELHFDDLGAAFTSSLEEAMTAHHVVSREASVSTAEAEPLFGGSLDGAGPALLVSLMVQEFNGRLEVRESDVDGSVFFFAGEPVWIVPPDGDRGLLRRLAAARRVAPDLALDDVVEGQLLAKLVERGTMTGEAMHDFMRAYLREMVLSLCTTSKGSYAFFEDSAFLDTVPLVKVNAFGLMLESRRRRTPPEELLRASSELEWKYMIPGPGLTPAAPKLKPFVRSADLAQVVNGLRRTKHFLQVTGLDPIMGSLVVLTLADARLVSLSDEPMAELPTVALADSTQVELSKFKLPDSDVADPSASNEEKSAKEEIFALYMQLKPLTDPGAVLGVTGHASPDELRRAFAARMRQLEPSRIPEGSARALMVSRVEELRQKVQRAFEALARGPIDR